MRFFRFVIIFTIIGAIFVYRDQLLSVGEQLFARALPCIRPIYYSVGTIDPRFGLTKQDVLAAMQQAESIWEKPIGRNLFEPAENGVLRVSFIYDKRQATTQKLRELGLAVDESLASYNQIKARYEALEGDYAQKKAALQSAVTAFNDQQAVYLKEVRYWNSRGGAPQAEYDRLQAEKAALSREESSLGSEQDALNKEVDDINALVVTLNHLADVLNLNVDRYNTVGRITGEEFEEGSYEEKPGSQTIEIYEFSSRAKLVRVLAHELGHALGLEHIEDKSAIMYRLNQGSADKASAGDITELKRHCGIPG